MSTTLHGTVVSPGKPSPAPDSPEPEWTSVCATSAIVPDTGVCALVAGNQVAVFRLGQGELYAVGNHDPYSQAPVISRGIVGDRGGTPMVASPVYKHPFDLRTGQCLDDIDVRLPVYAVRQEAGVVQVRTEPLSLLETQELMGGTLRSHDGGGES